MGEGMRIVLNDINVNIVANWTQEFKGVENVAIVHDDFRNLPLHVPSTKFVLCTAGNSYGVMGGGLDLTVARTFLGIEDNVQHIIESEFHGEMFVGQSTIIELELHYYPFVGVMYTPTMRAPMRLNQSENVYLATFSALNLFREYTLFNQNTVLVLPGFGGLCGNLHPRAIARAMRLAWNNHHKEDMPKTTLEMRQEHEKVKNCV